MGFRNPADNPNYQPHVIFKYTVANVIHHVISCFLFCEIFKTFPSKKFLSIMTPIAATKSLGQKRFHGNAEKLVQVVGIEVAQFTSPWWEEMMQAASLQLFFVRRFSSGELENPD